MSSDAPVERTVTIRLFAAAKERAGSETVAVSLPHKTCFGELRSRLAEAVPALRPIVPHLLFAAGTEYATDGTLVPDTGEIVAFPPVSGG